MGIWVLRKKRYQFRSGLAVILTVAMITGMIPATVHAMPETGSEQESEYADSEAPGGEGDTGSIGTENPDQPGDEEREKPSGAENAGNTETENPDEAGNGEMGEPSEIEDSGNSNSQEPGEGEDAGSTKSEESVEAEQDAGNPEPYQPEESINTDEEESLSNNTLLPDAAVQAETDENVIASGIGYDKNENLTWKLYKNGELVVEGTGEFTGYNSGPAWLDHSDKIESATVKVTGACSARSMFGGCKNLKTVDLKGFDTTNVSTMEGMFAGCSALETLDLSSFDTHNTGIMSDMFYNCSSLTTLNLSHFDTAQTDFFGGMFAHCTSLETLDLSSFIMQSNSYIDGMLFGCDSLREIKTPKQTDKSITLPETDGVYSWRTEDGTKILELPAQAETVSLGKKIGISFTGSNFTLKEFGDKKIEDIEIVFDKGSKESFTFTVVPEEGYDTTPEVKITGKLTRITVTQGEDSPYQYILAPKDAEQGYMRDEVISISVAKSEKYTLKFARSLYQDINGDKVNSPIYESVVAVNGEEVTDLTKRLLANPTSIEVSNEFDTTLYVKVPWKFNAGTRIPVIDIYENSVLDSKTVKGKVSVDSPTEIDKKYEQDGYCTIRLGRIYSNTTIRWKSPESPSSSKYSVHFTTEGLPAGCHVIGYLKDGYRIGELEDAAEIEIDMGEDFYVQVKWTDTQEAYQWCKLRIRKKKQGWTATDSWTEVDDIRTLSGVAGEVYYIGSDEHIDLQVSLLPHEISLGYIKGDLIDLAAGEGTKLTQNDTKIEVYSGDSPSVSFGLNDKLTLNGIHVTGENGEDLTDKNLVSYQSEEDNKWRVAVNDISKLYDIKGIRFDIKDELERISLADPENEVRVVGNYNNNYNGTKCVYNGKPIYGRNISVRVNGEKLAEGTDYTISYRNNVNAGRNAEMIVRAMEDSAKYRGEYVKSFTIEKASPFNILETQINVDEDMPVINLSERLVINAPYDRNVKPTNYVVVSCDLGGIFSEDAAVADDGYTLLCFLREDADRDSEPAKVVLKAAMQNYEDTAFTIKVHLVKREELILEGELTKDKVYDGRASYPDISRLQIPYKFPYLENPKEGEVVNAEKVSAEEAAKIRESISGTLTYHYIGIDGTVYDDHKPPVDVGSYKLQIKVSDENEYYRSEYCEAGSFEITKRDVVLTADDVTLYIGDTLPTKYEYTVRGLADRDAVSAEPLLSCEIQNTETAGAYPIRVNAEGVKTANADGKDMTANYRIAGEAGTLHVAEPKPESYTVTFDLLGRGNNIRRSGIEAGSLIPKPFDPVAAGCIFHGWYTDKTFSKMWDFAAGTLQSDMTLYAGWSSEADPDMELHVREILPQTYTGRAIKPAIDVYAADGKTLLKKNRDYSIVYKNNVDADTKKFNGKAIPDGGIGANIEDTESGFDAGLAYVVITGKGNYKGTVFMNFHITPADISGAGVAGSTMTLKYTEAFEAKSGKNAAIVTQLKSRTATLKYGKDYALTVKKADGTAVDLTDRGQLPLNAGSYRLTIEGKDNYTGIVEKDLYVAAREKLIKNARVKCKAAITNVTKEQLQAGISPQDLEVTLNGTPLTEGTDYEVTCTGNHVIGTATVIVKGIGEYFGSKNATFKIKGITFKEKEFGSVAVQDMTYTGTALTQNDVVLAKNGANLIYGQDYTVSYKNNIKKGNATMIFTANPSSGYSGSFKKTFKIKPLSLDAAGILMEGVEKSGEGKWTLSESVPYQKGGATPVGELVLRLRANRALLAAGRDYGVKYKDNTGVSSKTAYMTLTGKGNFTGSITVYFDIEKASLLELYQEKRITITSKAMKASMSYRKGEDGQDELKDPAYEFKPAVTVKDGKKALRKDEDYTVSYIGNVRSQLENGGGTPQAVITGIGNYSGTVSVQDQPVTVPLSIYQSSLSGSQVYVVYHENTDFTYTGSPITPQVTVYYGKRADISRAKRNKETDESVLMKEKSEELSEEDGYELTKLEEYVEGEGGDYILSYGANTAKGRTGKVIISGVYDYSGKVTDTFTIDPKPIYSIYETDEE